MPTRKERKPLATALRPIYTAPSADRRSRPSTISRGAQKFSERSRLPVILPIQAARHLPDVFPDAVCEKLAIVGVPLADIAAERLRMREMAFGRTRNRSLLGTMNDFALMAKTGDANRTEPESPEELMRFLSDTPILPLKGACPIDLTLALFRH